LPPIQSNLLGHAGTVLVVELPAQVVDETSELIRQEVARRLPNADGAAVVLDCRHVDLINSIGITCLLQVQEHCRRQKAGLVLAGMPAKIEQFLKTLRLDKRFARAPSVEEAVAQLNGTA
jgi:anti-anti-sigma factor